MSKVKCQECGTYNDVDLFATSMKCIHCGYASHLESNYSEANFSEFKADLITEVIRRIKEEIKNEPGHDDFSPRYQVIIHLPFSMTYDHRKELERCIRSALLKEQDYTNLTIDINSDCVLVSCRLTSKGLKSSTTIYCNKNDISANNPKDKAIHLLENSPSCGCVFLAVGLFAVLLCISFVIGLLS